MRIASFALILGSLAFSACGTVPNIQLTDSGTDTGTGTGTDTGTGTETSTTDTPVTSSASGGACVPGMSVACTCASGDAGAQVCNQSGSGYLPCECEGGESNSASEATPTTGPGPSTTTTDTGTTTDPGTSTEPDTTTDTTTEGTTTTGEPVCVDEGEEPNEDEAGAIDLGNQSCSDPGESFAGTLAGAADVDWFQYHAVDQGCSFVNDPVASQQITASEDVRLCVFVDCDNGNPTFQCEGGATGNDSPDGLPGCCNSGGNVSFELNCSNGPENAQIFVRVDQAPADACVNYEVEYDFD